MIRGLGIDIIEIERIRGSISRHSEHFLDKVFSEEEQAYCNKYQDASPHYAGRFAAKEAILKALGTGFSKGLSWLDIEVHNDENGKPIVILSENAQQLCGPATIQISISHCREYATAVAIISVC